MKTKSVLIFLVAAFATTGLFANNSVIISVKSSIAPTYQREKQADGSFKPETYVLANAGAFPGTIRDGDIEKVSYPVLAGAIAQQLASQNYFLAKTSKQADLLLVIHWGTTVPFSDPSLDTNINLVSQALASMKAQQAPRPSLAAQIMNGNSIEPLRPEEQESDDMTAAVHHLMSEYRYRDLMNEHNARLLGYIDEINSRDNPSRWAGAGTTFNDLMSDIEEARYYITISAFDLKQARDANKKTLLWTTRISMAQQGNEFEKKFAAMLATAKPFLGKPTDGLLRKYRPDARVDLGELKFLGTVDVPAGARN